MEEKDEILHEWISGEHRLIIRKSHAPGQIEYNGELIDWAHSFSESIKDAVI